MSMPFLYMKRDMLELVGVKLMDCSSFEYHWYQALGACLSPYSDIEWQKV
jgi:hypothetical protein